MRKRHNKKVLKISFIVLIAVLALGIGYAGVSAINLIINGNATVSVNNNNFKVHFIEAKAITGTTGVSGTSTIESDDTKATFNVSGLTKVGDYAEAKYVVKNDSASIGAEITLNLTNSNSEYFKVIETIDDNKLQAGEETYATVKVEMLKTPINDDVTTSVTATLSASPIENAQAAGGKEKEIIKPAPLVYTIKRVDNINIGTDISTWTGVYNNFQAAKVEFGYPAAIAHDTENGVVTASYIAFEINNKVYYLKGRIDESELSEKTVYDKNITVLKEAFGPNWQSACTDYTNYFSCTGNDFDVDAYVDGHVDVGSFYWYCEIRTTGAARCRN